MIINYSAMIKGCGCYDASFLRVIMRGSVITFLHEPALLAALAVRAPLAE